MLRLAQAALDSASGPKLHTGEVPLLRFHRTLFGKRWHESPVEGRLTITNYRLHFAPNAHRCS